MKKIIILTVVAITALSSCKKETQAPATMSKNGSLTSRAAPIIRVITDVYVAGDYTAKNGHTVAVYWKNGIMTKLSDSTTDSKANSIVVVGGTDIYVAGYKNLSTGTSLAAYWKNGLITTLSRVSSVANDIFVNGTDVYVAGNSTQGAALWKNNVYASLAINTLASTANAVTVSGGDVYVAGYTTGLRSNIQTATYWKNGTANAITGYPYGSYYSDVNVYNNSIYLSGTYQYKYQEFENVYTQLSQSAYWLNGVEHPLPASFEGYANHILVSNGTVYTAGESVYSKALPDGGPAYWVNNTFTDLSFDGGTANSIAVSGNDIYVAGDFGGSPTVWKNNTLVTDLNKNGEANDIVVVVHL